MVWLFITFVSDSEDEWSKTYVSDWYDAVVKAKHGDPGAVVTLLVTFAGSAAAAKAITDDRAEPRNSGLQYVTQTETVGEISHEHRLKPNPAVGRSVADTAG